MTKDLNRRQTWVAVIFAIVFPTILTWIYFIEFPDQSGPVGGIGKLIQFGFPAFWVFVLRKMSLRETGLPGDGPPDWSKRTSLIVGIGTGIGIVLVTFGYYAFALGGSTFEGFATEIEARVSKLSLDNTLGFAALGVFYALVHSFLEEYYFRWFVFGRLRHLIGFVPSAIISALAFMSHHVIILWVFFGGTFHTYFLSLSIAVGGLLWAWQYERSRSLIGPWVSHLLVDAGIFVVGYHLIFVALPSMRG